MTPTQIVLLVIVVVFLAVIVFPIINNRQLKNMPFEQQIRIIKKEADKLIYFKNISNGKSGNLVYVKNKRKMLFYPWVLVDGKMLCTKENPFDHWDHPDELPKMTEEEIIQAKQELEKYNQKNPIKLYLQEYDAE
ncbi:MAG: hypothetical protein ACI4IL_02965 [Eubacterium sp.]